MIVPPCPGYRRCSHPTPHHAPVAPSCHPHSPPHARWLARRRMHISSLDTQSVVCGGPPSSQPSPQHIFRPPPPSATAVSIDLRLEDSRIARRQPLGRSRLLRGRFPQKQTERTNASRLSNRVHHSSTVTRSMAPWLAPAGAHSSAEPRSSSIRSHSRARGPCHTHEAAPEAPRRPCHPCRPPPSSAARPSPAAACLPASPHLAPPARVRASAHR